MLRSRIFSIATNSILHTSKRNFFYKREIGLSRDWLARLHKFLDQERSLDDRLKEKNWKDLVEDQRYIEERHNMLGPDLATAHFIVARGGSIKFVGDDRWFYKENNRYKYSLPGTHVPGVYVEAIDASGMPIMHHTFDNLIHLDHLKYLNLSCCEYVDDYCLFFLHRFRNSLVQLNISKCPLITGAGIESLHHLKHLRRLEMYGMTRVDDKELLALMLEEALPHCIVEGVDYTDIKKLSQLKHNELEDFIDDDYRSLDRTKLLPASNS